MTRQLYGRRIIKTNAKEITRSNLIEELQKAYTEHLFNSSDIDYLWDYYRGKQDILNREKQVRPEINNKIVENRANEIVSFKVGYLCGEPIQYISRRPDTIIGDQISKLNEFMFSENKEAQDKEVVEWSYICGTAYRIILPDEMADTEQDEAPFEMHTLDPRNTFVVYSNRLGNKPMFAVSYWLDEFLVPHYSIYTKDMFYEVEDGKIITAEPHILKAIPIIEYPANNARLGAFEIVIHLLDKINNIESNRMDGIEQTVQAFIKFINTDISKEEFVEFMKLGAIKIKSVDGVHADVDVVKNELNQTQTQTLKDDTYQAILTICGIPNRNGGSSTSDTGTAVIMRDGWSLAEARAKDSEMMFKKSEQEMLKITLDIVNTLSDMNLKLSDIGIQFTRRNYENILAKAQVLTTMLGQEKIHPQLAFAHSGMFTDPEKAYTISRDHFEEVKKELQAQMQVNKIQDTSNMKIQDNSDMKIQESEEMKRKLLKPHA